MFARCLQVSPKSKQQGDAMICNICTDRSCLDKSSFRRWACISALRRTVTTLLDHPLFLFLDNNDWYDHALWGSIMSPASSRILSFDCIYIFSSLPFGISSQVAFDAMICRRAAIGITTTLCSGDEGNNPCNCHESPWQQERTSQMQHTTHECDFTSARQLQLVN